MNRPTFQEKIMMSFNLKKDRYPLRETQESQHDSKNTKTANNPTIGLLILTTAISPPSIKELIWMIRSVMLSIRF
jgi:hypothetical protein